MLRRMLLLFGLGMGCLFAQVNIPDTPAGQTLRAWFDAYNSGELARVDKFNQQFAKKPTVALTLDFRQRTGRLGLVSIENADRTHITFRVSQVATASTGLCVLEVTDGPTPQVVRFNFIGLKDLASAPR